MSLRATPNPARLQGCIRRNQRIRGAGKIWFVLLLLLLWIILSLSLGGAAAAQTQQDLFDNSVLQEVRLAVDADAWAGFKENFWLNDYIAGDVSWRGIVVKNIGIRHRGTGSRCGTKPYMGLKFDQYVKGQQFLGLSSLRLKNAMNDASFLREILGMELFRRMNVPAPRESYARLYVNDEYAGLYWVIEEIDNNFLDRVFGEHNGCLYSYNLIDEYHFEYLGGDPGLYSPERFEPKSCSASTDPAALIDMIRTMNLAPEDAFLTRISQFLDLHLFLKYLAVEQFLANFDFLLGAAGMNNFYLYRAAGAERFHFISWDLDDTLYEWQQSFWFGVDTNVLTRRLFQYAEMRAAYQEALKMVALEAGGAGGWLHQELERLYSQIHDAALEDPVKPNDNATFEESVNTVRAFVRARKDYVISQTGPLPPPAVARGGAVNGASFTAPLVAGSVATVFGTNLAYTTLAADTFPLLTTIGKTTVQVNGVAVPLLSVSPTQINFQVPWELAGQPVASLVINVEGAASASEMLNLAPMSPALFLLGSSQGAIVISTTGEVAGPNGSLRGIAARPARPGEPIAIYATGLGSVTNRPATGDKPPAGLCVSTAMPVVMIGGMPAMVTFSGLAPDSAGLYVINAQVPENVLNGDAVPVTITMEGITSNTVTMAIQ